MQEELQEVLYLNKWTIDILIEGSENVTVEGAKLKCNVTGHRLLLHPIPSFLNIHTDL